MCDLVNTGGVIPHSPDFAIMLNWLKLKRRGNYENYQLLNCVYISGTPGIDKIITDEDVR